MKKTREEMESELRLLVPSAPSDRVAETIANRLAATRPATVEQDSWKWGATALVVAATLAIAILWYPRSKETAGHRSVPDVGPRLQVLSELPPPTMLTYQRTLAKSPEVLDELLDRHAENLLVAHSTGEGTASLYQDLMAN